MNPDLKHREITQTIIKTFYDVYNELGQGFVESVYEKAMIIALKANGLKVESQVPIDVWYRGEKIGDFAADLLVEDSVLLELKSVRTLNNAHEAQLLNYLRATTIEVGLLLNFGEKPEFKRMAFDNVRKKIAVNQKLSIDDLLSGN